MYTNSSNKKNKPRIKAKKTGSFLLMCMAAGSKNIQPTMFPQKPESKKN